MKHSPNSSLNLLILPKLLGLAQLSQREAGRVEVGGVGVGAQGWGGLTQPPAPAARWALQGLSALPWNMR